LKAKRRINGGKHERREGAGIPLKRPVLNANLRAYRPLSGLIGFPRPTSTQAIFWSGLFSPGLRPIGRLPANWPVRGTSLDILGRAEERCGREGWRRNRS